MEAVRLFCGIGGGLAGAVGAVLYIWSIWRGESKPEFWTWFIFGIGVTGAAVYGLQGHPGLSGAIFPVTLAILIDIIFIHTWFPNFRYREGDKKHQDEKLAKWWHKVFVVPLAAVFYVLLIDLHWPPLAGVLGAIVVDMSALSLLLIKCWRKPDSEWWPAYFFGAVGGILGLIALQNWNFTTWAFPVYFAFTEALIVYVLLRQSTKEPVPQAAGA